MATDLLPLDAILKLLLYFAGALVVIGVVCWWMIGHTFTLARASRIWIRQSPLWHGTRSWRQRVHTRFPRFVNALQARLYAGAFSGLPLTMLVLASIYLAFLFGGLIEDLLESDDIEAMDRSLMDGLARLRSPALVPPAIWITDLGGMPALMLVALVATGFMWTHGPRRYIAPVWLTVAGSQVTTWSGKFLINRPRPDFILDVTAYSPSFPSGHATGAAAVLGIITYVVARDMAHPAWRFAVAYCSGIVIALVGISRVFLNVHFPSDVLAGFLVGTFWVLAGIALAELTRGHPAEAQH